MLRYIGKKILYGLLVMVGVVSIIFFLFNVLPVNSARMTMGQRADVATLEAIEKELGLNKPVWVRFGSYLMDISPMAIHEDNPEAEEKYGYQKLIPLGANALVVKWPYLGRSFQNRRLVTEILMEKLPPTFILASSSIILAFLLGIGFGIVAAIRRNTWLDDAILTISNLGISQPSYFTALIIAAIFSVYIFPSLGIELIGPLFDTDLYGDDIINWKNLILPTLALGLRPVAIITQLTRSSMLDELSQDYVRTAKAKGVSFRKIIGRHTLRNAMNPILTSVSGWYAALLAGSVFVEETFNYDGLGYTTVRSILNFDLPVAMGCVLIMSVVFVLINILVDVLYGFFDPRISYK
ncbi:MAG: ABC transporter permease [Chitinophagales bacterium]|nr:ABC transporter permease [Chitinophagales bacterium]